MCAAPLGVISLVSDFTITEGGPYRRDDEEDIGCLLERAEAKVGAAKRPSN